MLLYQGSICLCHTPDASQSHLRLGSKGSKTPQWLTVPEISERVGPPWVGFLWEILAGFFLTLQEGLDSSLQLGCGCQCNNQQKHCLHNLISQQIFSTSYPARYYTVGSNQYWNPVADAVFPAYFAKCVSNHIIIILEEESAASLKTIYSYSSWLYGINLW